jgi:hypothetical protein
MLNADLGKGRGSIIASAWISVPWLSGRPKDHEKRIRPGNFCNTSWFVGDHWRRTGYKAVRLIFDKTGKPNEEYEDFMTGFVKSAIFSSKRRLAKPS